MSPVVAIFNLGGGEIILILTLILTLFGVRTIPPMTGLKAGVEQFRRSHGQSDYEPRFDKDSLIDGITILLLIALSFTVLACLRS